MAAGFPDNLVRLWLRLLSRALYWLVRPRVFPGAIAELGLDPSKPICYVLDHQHLSNLLVLEREARLLGLPSALKPIRSADTSSERAFFFLSRDGRRGVFDPKPEPFSPLLRHLVGRAIANDSMDVQLVPVSIYWGRAPGRQDSVIKALFAETWRNTGRLRQMLSILIHGRHAVVHFSPALSLREVLADQRDANRGERKLGRVLRVHFRRNRERVIGPDLSHRHTLIRALVGSPRVQAAIRDAAAQKRIPVAEAEQAARGIALEIAADYSHTVVRALELFLDWLWTRLYDGIQLHGFERVKAIAPGHGIVYVPCHRSHIDYLLLSFVVFRQGMIPPHIAAGANLNLPLVGALLRRGGAFFLRRSFKGDALYAAIFIEYLQGILQRGFPVEYFVEGGRSRSGRTLAPKTGMLGMTLQGYAANPERPLVFVPVYVGYEKVMEARSFIAEINGESKRKESLADILRTARRLRREFGQVHVNFGEPLQAEALLDAGCPGWREMPQSQEALRLAVDGAAREIAVRINAAAVLNPVNLFALALHGTRHQIADRCALEQQIAHLQAIHGSRAYPGLHIGSAQAPEAVIEHAIRLGFARIQPHPFGDLVCADPLQAAMLSYFRNNVLHLFALPGMIACLLSLRRELPVRRVQTAIQLLYPLLRAELFLPWSEAQLPDAVAAAAQTLRERGLLHADDAEGVWRAPPIGHADDEALHQLGELLRPLLERVYLLLALLMRQGSGTRNARETEESAWLLAQRINLMQHGMAAEHAERAHFAQLLQTLISAQFVTKDARGCLAFDQRISAPAAEAELLLHTQMRHAIRRVAADHALATAA